MAHLAHQNPEELIQCPYDATHMVSHKIWQYHIRKCRKNHPNKRLEQCPFNARHLMSKEKLPHHIANCPDKVYVEQVQEFWTRGDRPALGGRLDVPQSSEVMHVDDGEDWDMEAEAPHFILGEPVHKDFTSRAGPHLPHHKPGLTPEYIYQPLKAKVPSEPSSNTWKPAKAQPAGPGGIEGGGGDNNTRKDPRLPREQPKITNTAGPISIGRGSALQMSRAAPAAPPAQPPQAWTALGRGRGRVAPNSAELNNEPTLINKNTEKENLRLPHTLRNGSVVVQPRAVNTRSLPMGRGRGRGIMALDTGFMAPGRASPSVSMCTDSPMSSSEDSSSQFEDDFDRERLKDERKLRKRLKQIETLEQRRAAGQTLTAQEKEKVGKKDSLLQQLRELKMVDN